MSSHVGGGVMDVLVVGGGPVGLATAIEARMAGLAVTVIEPRTGPIDKACGEGLMPGAIPLLARLDVHPVGRTIAGIGYYASPGGVEHRFGGGRGLGVRRTTLHAALAGRAEAVGVDLIEGRIDDLRQDSESVTVTAGGARIRARWLLGCDGLHSAVARMTGLATPAPTRARRYGIRQHFAIEPWSELVEVHYGPTAELYVTPVADGLVGVAMLGPRGADFEATLAAIPAVADRLVGVAAASERRGAGPFRQRTRARTAGRVLLVGDASGYVDALTGEGLRLGFAQASAALVAVAAGDPQRYEREWRAVTRDFRMLTTGLVAWAGSPLRGAIVPAASRAPKLFGAVVERLAR